MRRGLAVSLALSVAAASAGCSIVSTVRTEDTPVRSRPISRVIPSGVYEASAVVTGVSLDVTVSQPATCESGQAEIVRRMEYTTRQARPSPWAFVAPGLLLMGLGVGAVFGGPELASSGVVPSLPSSPLAYQIAGGVVGAGGLGLVIVGIAHAARARDGQRDLGEVEIPPHLSARPCSLPPPASIEAALILDSATRLRATADSGALFRFSMLSVSSAQVPTETAALALRIGPHEIPLSLAREQALTLRDALLQDERAVARRELIEQRKTRCASLAQHAEGMPPAQTAEQAGSALAAWDAARRTCGELFTADMEAKRTAALQAKERADADATLFASAVDASANENPEALAGQVVKLASTVAWADAEAGYIQVTRSETVCMREPGAAAPLIRMHWGRGGRGGGRGGGWRGGGGRGGGWGGGGWRSSSYRSSSKRTGGNRYRYRGYGSAAGSALDDDDDDDDTTDEPAAPRTPRAKKCKTVERKVIFRLAHPQGIRLAKDDYVRVFGLATRSPKPHQMYLVDPKLLLLTRGDKVLLGAVDGKRPL